VRAVFIRRYRPPSVVEAGERPQPVRRRGNVLARGEPSRAVGKVVIDIAGSAGVEAA